jgi:hypothetical protein
MGGTIHGKITPTNENNSSPLLASRAMNLANIHVSVESSPRLRFFTPITVVQFYLNCSRKYGIDVESARKPPVKDSDE